VTSLTHNAQIALSWNEPDNNGAALEYYLVEYKKQTDTSWSTKRVIDFNNTVLQDLENDVAYNVRISAQNARGASLPSNEIVATPNRADNTDNAVLVANML